MAKQIIFNEEARKALKRGVDVVANAVRITIGPRGRNVVLDKGFGTPTITNDGVSIAKEITLSNKIENMGAEIIKEVASKTNDIAGDGTTTSVILTQAIISEGLKHTEMGVNAMALKWGIEEASAAVVKALRSISKPIKNKEEIKQVATISAESGEIGKIIADTIDKVGKDGVVTVEEAQTIGIESDIAQGMEFDKGYISPYMVTNAERMEAVYRDVPVLVTTKKISVIKDILPLLEKLAQTGKKDLVIIADDVDGEALTTFILNKVRGGFNILAVKAPSFGDRKIAELNDIATTLGATLITDEIGINFDKAELDILGKSSKIISTKDKTVIVGGAGKKSDLDKRVALIKSQIDNSASKYDKDAMAKRIAKLAGGVAVIRVGAATETEMKYLKLKIEDAVAATRAAIEEGIVAGGGSALVKAGEKVKREIAKSKTIHKGEVELGYRIVLKAIEAPLRQIVENGGREDGAVIVEKVRNSKGDTAGYNALREVMVEDMLREGIIDPVKVTRTALQNASSAAAILLTTEVAIADEPAPEKPEPQMPGGIGGMY